MIEKDEKDFYFRQKAEKSLEQLKGVMYSNIAFEITARCVECDSVLASTEILGSNNEITPKKLWERLYEFFKDHTVLECRFHHDPVKVSTFELAKLSEK